MALILIDEKFLPFPISQSSSNLPNSCFNQASSAQQTKKSKQRAIRKW